MRAKLDLLCTNLVSMPLCWWKQIQFDRILQGKDKICLWPRMKKMLAIKFYLLDCDKLFSYTKQDYWPRISYLDYFEETYISPLREDFHFKENAFVEENIEVHKEVHEDIFIEEDLENQDCEGDYYTFYYKDKSCSRDGKDHRRRNRRGNCQGAQ